MSAMWDYMTGTTHGELGRARASEEYALGVLETEIRENERLRAKLDQIATVCADNAGPTCNAHMALDFIKQIATADS